MERILTKFISFKKAILILVLLIPLIYIGGFILLSFLSGKNFNEIILYEYYSAQYKFSFFVEYAVKPLMVLSGILIITFSPGILFVPYFFKKEISSSLIKFSLLGFFLNILLLIFGTAILKLCGITVTRFWFCILTLIFTFIGIFLFLRSRYVGSFKFTDHKEGILYMILLLVVIFGFILYFQSAVLFSLPLDFKYDESSILNMDFTKIGDPQEEFGIAYHLKARVLPYWLIDGLGRFGTYIYDPHLSYFLNFIAVLVFGESYAALNFLSLLFTLGIFFFVYKILCLDSRNDATNPLVYIGPILFMAGYLWLLLNPSRRHGISFFLWPENTLWDSIESIWVFLMMGTIFFLLLKEKLLLLLFSFLASLCRYESIPCIFILAMAYFFFFKQDGKFLKEFLKIYTGFVILLIIYTFVLCILHGSWQIYFKELLYDKIFIKYNFLRYNFRYISTEDRIWSFFNIEETLKFICVSMISTYFFIVLFLSPFADKTTRFLSVFGLVYFFFVVIQSHKLISYAVLLVPIAAINLRSYIYPSINLRLFNLFLYFIIWIFGITYLL